MELTRVETAFEWRFRNHFPLAGLRTDTLQVDDDGNVLVLVPDRWDRRLLHLLQCPPFDAPRSLFSLSTETLRGVAYVPAGAYLVGHTEEALYLASARGKRRLWSERAVSFRSVALTDTPVFAVAYSEKFQTGEAVLWCEFTNDAPQIRWLREFSVPLAHVALDRSGTCLVVASELGELFCYDSDQQLHWRRAPLEPLLALQTLGFDYTVFATETGNVGAIGDEGEILWMTEMATEIIALSIDTTHQTIAILSPHGCAFLSHHGEPLMEIDTPTSPTGIALSPSGKYATVSQSDGTLTLYTLTHGHPMARLDAATVITKARQEQASGNTLQAITTLRSRLQAVPTDITAHTTLQSLYSESKADYLRRAKRAQSLGDFRWAHALLSEASMLLPLDITLTEARLTLQNAWRDASLQRGNHALLAGDYLAAREAFLEALEAAPQQVTAREKLTEIDIAVAREWQEQAQKHLSVGEFAKAAQLLTQADDLYQTHQEKQAPETIATLTNAQTGAAFIEGKRLYESGEMVAAIFHFKKVLRLEPDHAEAAKYLRYAQNNQKEDSIADRFLLLE
jgi:tetratricopeptide (TPR) repeat protein